MNKRFAWELFSVALAFALCWAAPRSAEAEKKDARTLFKEGVAAYNAGKFEEAAAAFEGAYDLKPTYKLLFNIGQAYAAIKKYDLAIQAFERYLVDGGDDVTEDRRDEVLREIAKLRPLVGFIDVDAPSGVTVFVDGKDRGKTPLPSKIMATVGHVHMVVLKKDGEVVHTRKLSVFGGTVETVEYEEKKEVAPPPPEPEPRPESLPLEDTEEESEPLSTTKLWGWVAVGVGAGLLAGGGVTAVLASVQDGNLGEACPDAHCAPRRQGEIDALNGLALTTDILLAAGGVLAAAGIVLLVLPEKEESETAPGEGGPVEIVVLPSPTGVSATLTF
jgi:hypothetical protein